MDPNYVIVHCPKGHELQAAREHLTATLACPVCGIEFVPQSMTDAAAGPSVPPSDPAQLEYANRLNEPVEYPGVTSGMVWVWMSIAVISIIQAIVGVFLGPPPIAKPGQMPEFSGGDMAFRLVVGCVSMILLVVAVVLQLMWIYRIHKDAQRARGYGEVSPGMALGVSFIPAVNYIWTAVTMRKLSSFVASSTEGGAEPSERVTKAQGATRLCLIVGIIAVVGFCLFMSYGMYAYFDAVKAAGGVGPANQAAIQAKLNAKLGAGNVWFPVILNTIGLLIVWVYVRAVRRLEAALYPFLGAPER